MLRNDAEWKNSLEVLRALREQEVQLRAIMADSDETPARVELAVCGFRNKADDLEHEVRVYERLRAGDLTAVPHFAADDRAKALVCLRIVRGWTQRELAHALGVSEAAVSRDENNEYRGVSLAKYARVLAALGFAEQALYTQA